MAPPVNVDGRHPEKKSNVKIGGSAFGFREAPVRKGGACFDALAPLPRGGNPPHAGAGIAICAGSGQAGEHA
ncbi:hypothetical protein CDV52_08540 [Haematobacter missouriensis]|uniref:Uncharacterized protein n=1 Tax=Haematobacter missouriensis TaxID=366616 RepID=A0A212ASB3_9RHOB|nr:hypothetical protein CDV53_09145 [Haematobacter missouriensis]OWJ84397.1 hypothetical protein CDV52_08540 [Haematobacter missouriensis]